MHSLIAGVHLGGIYLAAIALAVPWRWAVSRERVWYMTVPLALTLLILLPAYSERRSYLEQNALWMRESQQGLGVEAQDLNALLDKLNQLPIGRIYTGHQYTFSHWSDKYFVGYILSLIHI